MLDSGEAQGEATVIHCDSHAAIAISKNPIFQHKTTY